MKKTGAMYRSLKERSIWFCHKLTLQSKLTCLLMAAAWRLHMFHALWLNSITYKSEAKPLGVYFCMFLSSVCDSTRLDFGSFKVHSFTTQRAILSLDETVIKPVYQVHLYLLHLSDRPFHFSLCISCGKTQPLIWHLKNRECLSLKGRENFLKRCSSKVCDTAL